MASPKRHSATCTWLSRAHARASPSSDPLLLEHRDRRARHLGVLGVGHRRLGVQPHEGSLDQRPRLQQPVAVAPSGLDHLGQHGLRPAHRAGLRGRDGEVEQGAVADGVVRSEQRDRALQEVARGRHVAASRAPALPPPPGAGRRARPARGSARPAARARSGSRGPARGGSPGSPRTRPRVRPSRPRATSRSARGAGRDPPSACLRRPRRGPARARSAGSRPPPRGARPRGAAAPAPPGSAPRWPPRPRSTPGTGRARRPVGTPSRSPRRGRAPRAPRPAGGRGARPGGRGSWAAR